MNTNDKRYIKNEKLIRETFIEMLRDMKYNQITVNALCDKALISKHTFYSHYESKDELVKSLIDEILSGLMSSPDDYYNFVKTNSVYTPTKEEVMGTQIECYDYIAENIDIFYVFFKNDSSISFSQRMAWFIRNNMLKKTSVTIENNLQFYMLLDYMVSGNVTIMKNWVLNKDNISLDEFKKFAQTTLLSTHFEITEKYLNLINRN